MEQSGRRPGGEPTRRGGKPTPRTCSVAAVDARRLLPASIVLGVANAGLFLGFEYLVNHGTEWLWDDVANSDDVRWRVIPLAIAGSVVYSLLLKALREPRVTRVEPHTALELDDKSPATFRAVWVILAIGLV